MYPDLELLDDLLALAETGHFGKAARLRNVSVATLSRRLSRLEREFGRRLVVRGPAGTEGLTAAGIDLVVRARPLLRDARRLLSGGSDTAEVRLGVCGTATDHMGARDWEILTATLTAATGVRVRMVDVTFDHCDDVVRQDGCDLIVQQVEPSSSGIADWPMGTAGRIAVMARTHPLAGRAAVSVAELEPLPVLYPAGATAAWVAPWVLNDVVTARSRPLIGVRTTSFAVACRSLEPSGAVAVTSATVAHRIDPAWSVARIADAPDLTVRLHLSRGRRRGGVLDVAAALASSTSPMAVPG